MRVAVISDLLRATGANIMAATCANLMRERGHAALLLSGGGPAPSILSLLEGTELDVFVSDDAVLDSGGGSTRNEWAQAAERWIYDALEAWRPDVVVCHNVGRILDQVAVARLSQTYPVAVVLHDEWFLTDQHYVTDPSAPSRTSYEPFRSRFVREHDFTHLWRVPAVAQRLVAVAPSAWLQGRWSQVFPTVPCALVHNPVDPADFGVVAQQHARDALGLRGGREIVGFVGDPQSARKNLPDLLAAVASIPRDGRPLVLIAGGSASWVGRTAQPFVVDDGLVSERIRENGRGALTGIAGSDPSIALAGVKRRDLALVYSAMDLLVHPSVTENLPTVPIEARYCGVPLLVSDVGGSREVVEHDSDLFPGSLAPKKLGQRIRSALDANHGRSDADREASAAQAREQFSPDAHYRALMSVIRGLVG